MSQLEHRLAAILAADAAGYSRLMSIDDQATVAALDAARAVFRAQIEAQQGRVIDMAGDSVLAVCDKTAFDLLSKLGLCRHSSTIHFARVLARQLGVAEQRARDEQERFTPQGIAEHGPLGVRRAMVALHEAIGRRGWA